MIERWLRNWAGHAYTILPNIAQRVRPKRAPAAQPWSTTLRDPNAGELTLRGELRRERSELGSKRCVVVVHGLGGSIDRHYAIEAARAAERVGMSCLRFGLRGADRQGEDFYHAGLVADIEAAIASAALIDFESLYVLGYSLGGHVTLRYALRPNDPRVRAVAAVCAPLDLERAAQLIDHPRSFVYRGHVLSGLNEIYGAVAKRHAVPTPAKQAAKVRSIRVWDGLTVVPRFGLGSVDNYYQSMSVGPRLPELKLPSLLVQSLYDPMVPPWTYEPHLTQPIANLTIERLSSGGHVAFPSVRLGHVTDARPLADQVLEWMIQR